MCKASNTPATLVNWKSVTGEPFVDWQCDVCGQLMITFDLPIPVYRYGSQECSPNEFPLADAHMFFNWRDKISARRFQRVTPKWGEMSRDERKEFIGD